MKELLLRHKFQFVSFVTVYYFAQRRCAYGIVNDDCHLLHITQGVGTVFIGKQRFPFKKGVVISIPPFVEYYIRLGRLPFEMLNIHYRIWTENNEPLDELAVLPITFKPHNFAAMELLLRRMQAAEEDDNLARYMKQAPLACEIVMRHFTDNSLVSKANRPLDPRIKKTCALLTSPQYQHFNAGEAARSSCLSVSQMNRIFRRCFRISPHRMWEKHRFAGICRQLRSTDQSVGQIAAANGFQDEAYFSTWFKRVAGCSAVRYRNKKLFNPVGSAKYF